MPSPPKLERCSKCDAELIAEGLCPACMLDRGAEDSEPYVETGEGSNQRSVFALPQSFGDYELIEEIACGGMGVVYKARQVRLNRLVAIKMILRGRLASDAEVRRFRAEAETAAQLQHPNIVAIHEVGEQDGQPFFSMAYVEGCSLTELTHNEPVAARRAAEYLKTIAEAVQYAHSRGVLHRDLKPSNILIDESDQPRITDFGLAKRLDSTSDLTLTGQVLGSPSFMPPEQAGGKHAILTPASDVYSLGAVLFHVITGRAPFIGESLTQTLRLVAESEPPSPRLINPSIPRDLETICLKCLQKEPARRYATALALSQDLDRFLKNEPVLARPTSQAERVWRWCRRYPAVTMLGVITFALLLTVAIGSSLHASRLKQANLIGQQKLWSSYLGEARAKRFSGRPGRRFESLNLLKKAAEIRPSVELRNEAIQCMALVDLYPAKVLDSPAGALFGTSFDSDYKRYARFDQTGTVTVRQLEDNRSLLVLSNLAPVIEKLVFSRGGHYLAVGAGTIDERRRDLWVFNVDSGKTALRFTNGLNDSPCFFNEGGQLLLQREIGGLRSFSIQDVTTGSETWSHPLPSAIAAAHLHQLEHSVTKESLGDLKPVTVKNPIELLTYWTSKAKGPYLLAWNPPNDCAAVAMPAERTGKIQLWDFRSSPHRLLSFSHGDQVISLRFNPQCNLLASVGYDNQLRIWDVATGRQFLAKPVLGYKDHSFSSDGRWLACEPSTSRVEICEVADGRECMALNFAAKGRSCCYSPDDRMIVSSHEDGARIWDPRSGWQLAFLPVHGCSAAFFDATGKYLFTGSNRGLKCWELINLETNALQLAPTPNLLNGESVNMVALDETQKYAAAIVGGDIRIIDLSTGQLVRTLGAGRDSTIFNVALSPGGKLCAGTSLPGDHLLIWNGNSGMPIPSPTASRINGLKFSPDGRYLITGSPDEYVAWDASTWRRLWSVSRQDSGGNWGKIAYTRDGKLAAVTLSGQSVRLLEPATGQEVATFEAPEPKPIVDFAFSHDGRQLAVVGEDSIIHLWDLGLIRRELAMLNLDWDQPPLPAPKKQPPAALRISVLNVRVPQRDSGCSSNLIDLTEHYNVTFSNFSDASRMVGNDLARLPIGLQTLAGTQFDVRGVVNLSAEGYPDQITGIRVNRACRSLNFLQSAMFAQVAAGKIVGEYIIHFIDGSEESVPLQESKNIADWWMSAPRPIDTNTTTIAWQGSNSATEPLHVFIALYKFHWVNPRPDIEIASIDFKSTKTQAVPFLIAITAE